jgi:hypothetical protein
MRNRSGDYTTCPGGDGWTLWCRRAITPTGANRTKIVQLWPDGEDTGVVLPLTTGEARIPAAELVAYAVRMDF